jgi:NAD(P)-dependent dehydrogenase (short-subunit alcohol dehydrogenase family)
MDWLPMPLCRKVMEVNFFGLLGVTQALLQHLKRNRGSRIINMSSLAGFSTAPGMFAYSASKHAVEGLAKGLKEEMSAWGVSSVVRLAFHPRIYIICYRLKSQT